MRGTCLISRNLSPHVYAFVVKSVSVAKSPPSVVEEQLQLVALLFPHAQVEPDGGRFSVAARSQVHCWAGRASAANGVLVLGTYALLRSGS
jgi:hypothetical protein